MKKTLLVVGLCIALVILVGVNLADAKKKSPVDPLWFDAGAGYNIFIPADGVTGGVHVGARVGYKVYNIYGRDISVYIPFTFDMATRSTKDKRAGEFAAYGPGIGAQIDLFNDVLNFFDVAFWAQFQYFFVDNTNPSRKCLYHYGDYSITDAPGGAVGVGVSGNVYELANTVLRVDMPYFKNLDFASNMGYRFVRFNESWKVCCKRYSSTLDMSGITFDARFVWRFK